MSIPLKGLCDLLEILLGTLQKSQILILHLTFEENIHVKLEDGAEIEGQFCVSVHHNLNKQCSSSTFSSPLPAKLTKKGKDVQINIEYTSFFAHQ